MLSVVIPARNEQFLQQTIAELLTKSRGEIEVIVSLDGYWPDPPLKDDPRLKIIHRGSPLGMRAGINSAVEISKGEYLMKIDAHCMLDEGFDEKLIKDYEENTVVIPRRKRLDAENWQIQDVGKPDVDYEYLTYPDNPNDAGGPGFNGRIWTQRAIDRIHDKKYDIDETPSAQGSCWFMSKKYFLFLELMDEKNFGPFWNEMQEIGFKAWLSGGRILVNKKTWYAHLHKGKKYGRGYFMDRRWHERGALYTKQWSKKKMWEKQIYPLSWLIERFHPMPGWDDEKLKNMKKEEEYSLEERGPEDGAPMDTFSFILKKYKLSFDEKVKNIEIPDMDREDLAKLFHELGYATGAEVGIERGKYSEKLLESNKNLKLYCIDPWEVYKGYREHVTQSKLDGFLEETRERLDGYNYEIIKKFSSDAVTDFEDESLDFVYIDGNHTYQNVVNDLCNWWPKVRKGGILAGHDYKIPKNAEGLMGVVEAVNGFTQAYRLKPLFLVGTKRIVDGQKRDDSRSWFIVKR